MKLNAGFITLAVALQEATARMGQNDLRTRLADALADKYRGSGKWAYMIDVFGSDSAGDLIYSCDGDICKAPYTADTKGATIDFTAAKDVVPLTTYQEEPEEILTEAGARHSRRDLSQLQAIHDHAAELGANCSMKESAQSSAKSGHLKLTECADPVGQILLQEAEGKLPSEIKLIAPGKGAMAFYPADVLKRDGARAFPAETKIYINHPTKTQESEGAGNRDVKRFAGVTTAAAEWKESHAKGPGLYAPFKVFTDHAQLFTEKAPYLAMSIMANGRQAVESGKLAYKEGVPLLAELVRGESVDVVPVAGAGGMILTEAARGAENTKEKPDMADTEEMKSLRESVAAQAETNRKLLERLAKSEARDIAAAALEGVTLPDQAKRKVIDSVLRESLPMKDGAVDETKLRESVTAEAKREGEYLASLSGSGQIQGMGAGTSPAPIDPKEAERRAADEKAFDDRSLQVFESLMGDKRAAEFAAKGRAA